jgi:hypothetical protein
MISVARYREITTDDASVGSAVEAWIAEAVTELEEYLDRPLDEDERTESMRPDRHGRLWPRATPIASAEGYTVDGFAIVAGTPLLPVGSFLGPETTVEVTYTGGWTEATLPLAIQRDLALAAYRIGHPSALTSDVPEGATSVRLGDAAVTYGPGGPGARADSSTWWSKRTRSYRYVPVHTGPAVA